MNYSDRSALVRLAASLPKGSPEREAIVAGLARSLKTAKLMSRQEALLQKYMEGAAQGGGRAATSWDELPDSVRAALRKVKDQETIEMDVDRWFMDNAPARRWAGDQGTERRAVQVKVSHRPILSDVTLQKYRAGEAMMLYFIDAAKNHSKFYEMAVVPDASRAGSWTLKKRWGALTDAGSGRVDSKDVPGLSYDDAVSEMMAHGKAKLRKGYQDAFKSRPVGQYPVGLSRSVGFGWGAQGITQCVPALRDISLLLKEAILNAAQADGPDLTKDLKSLQALLKDVPDSSMAAEINKMLRPPLERMSQNPKFVLDPSKTSKELMTLSRYIDRQLSECSA